MSETNKELELYKLITEGEFECGWISDTEFLLWVSHCELGDFVTNIVELFGSGMLEAGNFDINLQEYCVCMDLTAMLYCSDVDFERVFPREEFKH